jgi:ribosomal protein L37AE/L43A
MPALAATCLAECRFNCDSCDPNDTVKFPKGTLMWGCRECDFDWCGDCFKAAFPDLYELDMERPVTAPA